MSRRANNILCFTKSQHLGRCFFLPKLVLCTLLHHLRISPQQTYVPLAVFVIKYPNMHTTNCDQGAIGLASPGHPLGLLLFLFFELRPENARPWVPFMNSFHIFEYCMFGNPKSSAHLPSARQDSHMSAVEMRRWWSNVQSIEY